MLKIKHCASPVGADDGARMTVEMADAPAIGHGGKAMPRLLAPPAPLCRWFVAHPDRDGDFWQAYIKHPSAERVLPSVRQLTAAAAAGEVTLVYGDEPSRDVAMALAAFVDWTLGVGRGAVEPSRCGEPGALRPPMTMRRLVGHASGPPLATECEACGHESDDPAVERCRGQ